MITIKPFNSYSYDVTQLGNVHEDKIIQAMELIHQAYPGQTEVILKAGGFGVSRAVEEKALALAGLSRFAAAKQTATGKVIF